MSASETVFFCGKCGSPSVTFSALVGGSASCEGCGWKGQREDLVAKAIPTKVGTQEQVIGAFTNQVTLMVTRTIATPLARLLADFGFLDVLTVRQTLPRYLRAVSVAMATSIIEERKLIEKERADAG